MRPWCLGIRRGLNPFAQLPCCEDPGATHYIVGNTKRDAIKLDLFYTDKYTRQPLVAEDIRLASVEDIIAMKTDIVQRAGRKKDFGIYMPFLTVTP